MRHSPSRSISIAIRSAALLSLLIVALAARAAGLEASAPVPATGACDTPQHHQFDFWVGDWQVFDAQTQKLVAIDRIEKHSQGCIVQQNLTFVTDMYRRPGATYRLAGIGVNRFDGEAWVQLWADNMWGAIALRGTVDEHGALVFKSILPSRNRDLKIVYEKHADGTVRNLEYVSPTGTGKWELYGDLIYRPNN